MRRYVIWTLQQGLDSQTSTKMYVKMARAEAKCVTQRSSITVYHIMGNMLC